MRYPAINDVEEALATKGLAPKDPPQDPKKKKDEKKTEKPHEPPHPGGWNII